jgi:nitroimidazol reductase NimA-like FMN-containing flavoprotein (pyridoxamine 5'-phosphate oxidase superfamily)
MFGKLGNSEIEELIKHEFIGHLACHADDKTYVVPVSYAYDGTYIYVHALEGMKLKMMRKNPKVCFVVDNTRNMSNWQSVVMWGIYEELEEGPDREGAVAKLEARALPVLTSETMHLTPQWPFPSDTKDISGIVFRIYVTEKTGRYEKSAAQYFFAT